MDAKLPPRHPPAVSSAPQREQVLPIQLAAHPQWPPPQDPSHPPHIPPVSYQNTIPASGPARVPTVAPEIAPAPAPTLTNPPVSSSNAPYVNEPQPASSAATSNRQDVGKTPAPKPRKPRKADKASGRSTLFWVNSDQQSVSEGAREDTLKRIRSHVMSEHNRKKRLENTKRYKSKTWKHLAFQPVETAAAASAGPSAPAIGPMPPPPGRSSVKASSASRGKQPSRSGSNNDNHANDLVVTSAPGHPAVMAVASTSGEPSYSYAVAPVPPSPSPTMFLGHGAHADPFNMAHTPLTDRMFRHLQRCKFIGA